MVNAELLREVKQLEQQIRDEKQSAVQLRSELRNGSHSSSLIYEVNQIVMNVFF